MSRKQAKTDVVIVGAGFTGLSAAQELRRAGVDFVILEARDRVGGRVEARRNGLGELVDTGGQFLCDDMPELMALVKARGKTRVEAHVDGEFIAQPPLPGDEAERNYLRVMEIRERMNGIEPDDPAIAGLTVAEWLERQHDPVDAKAGFRSMIEGLWCQALEKVPLWHLIDNDRRITNDQSELQYFLAETMQSLADDLARDLGDRLRLGAAVTAIEHASGGVKVMAGDRVFEARSVLVAVPPMMASKLAFSPPSPARLTQALGVWHSGVVIKVLVRYSRAFWRERGLSGMVMWRNLPGLFACDAGKDENHPALVVFIGGPLALRWGGLDETALRGEVMSRLVAALGPEAGAILDFSYRSWIDDAWSGGAYSDLILDVNATDAEDVLLAGASPVHFASSELSPSFPGYIEGAIVAGRIAAHKVMADLQETT
ncbi:flavin monoamine oxidase family protein [Mesorhizobium sp. KR2-14]|uniref:flavin monoamine oxidase family protein n=1 Tax=Mesorhizobium sp. KR2-14 TaxID=3156610 RepID=UPI0032B62377